MPAPRRTSDRGDRRRRQIIDAALAEVRAQPVADVQLAAIATTRSGSFGFEGWLRSRSRSEFAEVGQAADREWWSDLVECLDHAAGRGGTLPEPAADCARRFLILLDGLAVHILSDHIGLETAKGYAMTALRSELAGL